MALHRVLEPELMDTPEEARAYDAMDHAEVNARFCDDLLALGPPPGRWLDVGAGTALVPIALCRKAPDARVLAVDLAAEMLALARENVRAAGLEARIELALADAKALPFEFEDASFPCVASNSLLHHLREPGPALAGMLRVLAPSGLLFVRDLFRPASEGELRRLVDLHAAGASPEGRARLEASLRAALRADELRALLAPLGVPGSAVRETSDRHVTVAFRKTPTRKIRS